MMVFVSLCNRLQQIVFRSMLRFLFILANVSLLLVWDCQPFTKRGNVPSFAWTRTWRWTCFDRNLSPIHMSMNMIFIWKALRFFLSKESHFQPCFHSRPGNSMRKCEVVYLKPHHDKYYLPTRGFWWAVCDLSFHSLLLKMWVECYDNALVVLYLLLSVCTSLQSETGKLWFCCFHSQNVKIFYANYVDLHCIWSGLTGIPSL